MVTIAKKFWVIILVTLFLALLAIFAWLIYSGNAVEKIPTRGVFI